MSLAWPNHVHHVPATTWFAQRGPEPWATTPMTEAGFVRVSSNPSAIPGAVTPTEALALLARISAVPGFRFLADDVGRVVGTHIDIARITSHRQVTDAHLLAVARHHQGRLATFDRGLAALAGGADILLVPFA